MGQPDLTYVLIDFNGTTLYITGLNRDLNSAFIADLIQLPTHSSFILFINY